MSQNIKDFLPPDWELIKEHDLAKPVTVASDVVDKSDHEFQVVMGLMAGILLALSLVSLLIFWLDFKSIEISIICLIFTVMFWAFYRATNGEKFNFEQNGSHPLSGLENSGPTKVGTNVAGTSLYPSPSRRTTD